jgi:hypothetical protein
MKELTERLDALDARLAEMEKKCDTLIAECELIRQLLEM